LLQIHHRRRTSKLSPEFIKHYRRKGQYLIPAKSGPIETSSKTSLWIGTLGLILLGASLSGAGLYGLAKTRSLSSTTAPVATNALDTKTASRPPGTQFDG
jgi:hypothetical protein